MRGLVDQLFAFQIVFARKERLWLFTASNVAAVVQME
jgi:hypothetical protein